MGCKSQHGGYLNMTKNLEIFYNTKPISNLIYLKSARLSPRRTKKGGGGGKYQ